LKKRKVAVEIDIQSLIKDDSADKTKKQHKLTLISKSNVMRHAAKEKSDELTFLSQELDSKLLELKKKLLNCLYNHCM